MRGQVWMVLGMTAGLMMWSAPGRAQEQCVADYVLAPDKTSLSILFDDMTITAAGKRSCAIDIDLGLPEGTSLGVYRVDYRGFANLARKEEATLAVEFALGPKGNGRNFKRTVRGALTDEFSFTENIGAGLMKRVGCGTEARLSGSVSLELAGSSEAMVTLDSGDGASRRGLEYKFNLKKC